MTILWQGILYKLTHKKYLIMLGLLIEGGVSGQWLMENSTSYTIPDFDLEHLNQDKARELLKEEIFK